MKKTIIISNYDDIKNPYYAGGGAYAVHEVAKRLSKSFNVTVITGTYPGAKNQKIHGVAYERIGTDFGGPKIGQLMYQTLLPYHVSRKKFDLWVESFTPPFSTNFLQLYTKKPVVGLIHMLASEDMKRKYKLPFDVVENAGLKTYNYFISTSEIIREKIKQLNPKATIEIIPNGIEKIKLNTRRKKEYILFLGRIEVNQKGLDLLLEGFKKIHKTVPYKLAIAGNGEEKQIAILKSLIVKKELEDSVVLLGRVDGEKKKEVFEKSVCMVLPARFETFSIVALEALAYGVPLISFDIPGLSWIPNTCRVTVKSFDVQTLAKKIKSVSQDVVLQKQLIKNGKKLTEKYTWDHIAEKYQQYFSQVLNK